MTTGKYLTARCPTGCEVWLHPRAVAVHLQRCPGRPWTDGRLPVSEVLLAGDDADLARSICSDSELVTPTFSGERTTRYVPGLYLRDEVTNGIVVRSPLDGVTGRRWWRIVREAAQSGRPRDGAFEIAGFEQLERTLGLAGHLVPCEVCGDDVTAGGLRRHQQANSICRFLSAVAGVHELWEQGYRDPYGLQHLDVPTTWTKLNSRVCWKRRLQVVRFRLWNAVMLAPES